MSSRKHDKATAEAIFNMIDWPESVVIRDDGVYLNEDFCTYSPRGSVFDWTPAYDMDWEGAPNPITAPVLPIVNFHAKLTRHFHLKLTHPLA